MSEFNVYDDVWIMQNNSPTKLRVFAVVESADYFKQGVEYKYHLVHSFMGVGWGNNEGIVRRAGDIYPSKEMLLEHL